MAWQALAGISLKLGDKESTLVASKKITQLNPRDGFAWYKLALAYIDLNRQEEAAVALENAWELKLRWPNAGERLHKATQKLKEMGFRQFRLQEDGVEHSYNLGLSYTKVGDVERAVVCWRNAIQ